MEKTENSDWATMADEEDWKMKHEELKVTKKDVKVERVVLASCSDDGTIRLWLPIESSELSCLVGHSGKVTALATGHDGFICSAGLDRSMKLWKATAMSPSVGHESDVTAAICSQDGSTLVTTGRDGTMRIWSRQVSSTASTCSGVPQLIMTVKVGKKSVNCAQFVGSNNLLLSGSDDGYVVLWDLGFGKFSQAKKLASLLTSGPVSSLVVMPSDSPMVCNVFVTHLNCVVSLATVKNLGTKDPDMTITALLKGHSDWCVASTTAIVGGRSVVLTGGADSCVLSWQSSSFDKDVATTKGVNPSNVPTRALVYESSEETLNWVTSITAFKDFVYFGDSTGNLISLKFDRITGTHAVLSQKRIHAGRLTCIVCVDALIFTGSSDRTIKVWNTNLVQVGQFLCKAPVTCLALAENEPIIPNRHRLIGGNSLGEVLFLAWIY